MEKKKKWPSDVPNSTWTKRVGKRTSTIWILTKINRVHFRILARGAHNDSNMRLYISITQQSNNQFEARELMGTYLHNVIKFYRFSQKKNTVIHIGSLICTCASSLRHQKGKNITSLLLASIFMPLPQKIFKMCTKNLATRCLN